jgi:hypothetical protein
MAHTHFSSSLPQAGRSSGSGDFTIQVPKKSSLFWSKFSLHGTNLLI